MKAADERSCAPRWRDEQSEQISATALAIHERLPRGGKLILFGNGGSATDANDWALDCVAPPAGYRPVPAVSLSLEPANISAIANDVGIEVDFPAPAHRAGAAGRCGHRHLHQRRLAQHHHGAGRGAQAQTADGRAAGL